MNPKDMFKNLGLMEKSINDIMSKMNSVVVEGESGAGMVKVKMNGKNEVVGVEISDDLFSALDKSALEVLLISAFNDACIKVKESVQSNVKLDDLLRHE